MSRYHAIIKDDVVNGFGISTSFWVQGCPHHCPGCFNLETWDFSKGQQYSMDTTRQVIEFIGANGIRRNLSILGGEPFAPENLPMVSHLIKAVKKSYPDIKILIWTGYYLDKLDYSNVHLKFILNNATFIIDGPFLIKEKDLNLHWRGSWNQRIWYHTQPNKWEVVEVNEEFFSKIF